MTAYRMGRAAGYISIVGPSHSHIERDTLQCVHCSGHWSVEPGSGKQRGWCTMCNGPHCGRQNCWECVPFMKKIEEIERKARILEAIGVVTR